jgi:hypothetical protein
MARIAEYAEYVYGKFATLGIRALLAHRANVVRL